MFYLSMNESAAQAASKSLGAWIDAVRSWNAAYARAMSAGTQSLSMMSPPTGQPATAFQMVDPQWAMESAGLFVRAWSDTVRAAGESWGAAAALGQTNTHLEPNPFGLTGLFTSSLPSSLARPDADATGATPKKKRAAPAPGATKPAVKPTAKKKDTSTFLKGAIGEPDDLTLIKGVGPKLRDALHDLGIFHYWQIASLSESDVEQVSEKLGFKGRIEREEWVEQARELIEQVS